MASKFDFGLLDLLFVFGSGWTFLRVPRIFLAFPLVFHFCIFSAVSACCSSVFSLHFLSFVLVFLDCFVFLRFSWVFLACIHVPDSSRHFFLQSICCMLWDALGCMLLDVVGCCWIYYTVPEIPN